MTPKALAKLLIENKASPLQVDAYIQEMFPDFGKFFISEDEAVVIEFFRKYLPECRLDVEVSTNNVRVLRDERIPGVGLYPHLIGYAQIKQSLASSILAAGLFAYDYLSS